MRKISALKVAGTYIGTVVGAGFASGQELLQFFAVFGIKGFVGIILVTVLFMIFGYFIMKLGMQLQATSHMSIIRSLGGKYLGPAFDFFITFFLFGSVTVMIAGAGAALHQQFNVPIPIGNALVALITAYTVMLGLKGIINSISMVVPFLIVSSTAISVYGILFGPEIQFVHTKPGSLMGNWLVSSILYISYNIIISIAVLGPLGARVNSLRTIRRGAILGGIGLGFCAVSIFLVLSANIIYVGKAEVPMILIASRISNVAMHAYSLVLLAEIYTTSVSSMFGFVARIVKPDTGSYRFRFTVILTAFVSYLSSLFGFSNMVKYLYPLVGYCGCIILVGIVYKMCQPKSI